MSEVTMPQLGETVTEGTITKWFKQVGDEVAMDEVLFEVSTDKVDSEVPSPAAGVLEEILVQEGETVDVGQLLARLGDGSGAAPADDDDAEPAEQDSAEEEASAETEASDETDSAPEQPDEEPAPAPAEAEKPAPAPESSDSGSSDGGADRLLSPVVRRLVNENGLDVAAIEGTGLGGRITRADVEKAIADGRGGSSRSAPSSSPSAPAPAAAAPERKTAPPAEAGEGSTTEPLNNIRLRTGEHMVMSKATSPHVLTAIEVDYERVERVRKASGAAWKDEHGFSLTYLPFIAYALTDALREFPNLNASVGDGELVLHDDVNLAIAVDLNYEGLLAPVVRNAGDLRLRAIAENIHSLAGKARAKKVSVDEVTGGTFTITNAGGYGTMMQFPIINQPQVAILSTDGISRKPVVVTSPDGEESIAIHSVGVLALAWDHRAFDGAYAAAFLARLKEILETHDWESEL